jgi:hypothetical protein
VVTEVLAGVVFGALLGAVFAPLRLAGVDYGKWYRDPGEVSEYGDRSWIGMMKWTLLYSANRFLLVLLAMAMALPLVPAWGHALFAGGDAPSGQAWRLVPKIGIGLNCLGLALGIVLAQGLVEILWRCGLNRGSGRPRGHIRLARAGSAPRTAIRAAAREARGRRLIVCCDGTWNSPLQARETNVVQLLRAIKPVGCAGGRPVTQIAYYHLGVGTGNFVDRWLGGLAGLGLSGTVKACYGFLVDNYQPDDEILLFGFSRGAYVVRSVAGMLDVVGLLHKDEMFRFAEAWDYYASRPRKRNPQHLQQIAPRRRRADISCLAVWDTVGALGVPGTRVCAQAVAFHQTMLGGNVRYAFQALALDERRGNFQPAVWVGNPAATDQLLEQVWFPGVHSNIGGGYLQHGLSDATLLWMLDRVQHYGLLDIDLDTIRGAVARYCAEKCARGTLKDSRTYFWKALACPVPRPVAITDDSERVHETALIRTRIASPDDPYGKRNRQSWLCALPERQVWEMSAFERDNAFAKDGNGVQVQTVIAPRRGLCARVTRFLSGPM